MEQETTNNEEQRGKRRSATAFEIVAVVLLSLAVIDYKETGNVFVLAFPACLAYSASLRGIDAHYNPKRV